MALIAEQLLNIAPGYRLQWEEAQQRHVILYPEGLVELNQSSTEILQLCDGTRTLDILVAELEAKFETQDLKSDISEFLEDALNNGWIKQTSDQ